MDGVYVSPTVSDDVETIDAESCDAGDDSFGGLKYNKIQYPQGYLAITKVTFILKTFYHFNCF